MNDAILYKSALERTSIVEITDEEGVILDVNDKACEAYGYGRDELIGRSMTSLSSGLHPDEFFEDLHSTIRANRVWRGEMCNRTKDGRLFWVSTAIVPLERRASARAAYMAICHDVTEEVEARRQHETECLRRAYQSKMSLLAELSAGIAHEVNNPLAILACTIERLRNLAAAEPSPSDHLRRCADTMEKTMTRISGVVKNLRDLAQERQQGPAVSVHLGDLFDETLALCRERFAHHDIELRMPEKQLNLHLECHPGQISQVLLALLNNAFEAVRNSPVRWVSVDVEKRGDAVELAVSDSGRGVHPNIRAKIFRPFFSTKPPGQGAGLGLSVAAAIVEAHGGHLRLDPLAPWTRFVALLPAGIKVQ